jgi:hypothetical protein
MRILSPIVFPKPLLIPGLQGATKRMGFSLANAVGAATAQIVARPG